MESALVHRFVDLIPDKLEAGTVYVCIPYATVVHACCCGCGREVVTPLTPLDWKLTFDGETISLAPSIGNWSLECQSHYWIKGNRVHWAPRMSAAAIERGRAEDRARRQLWAKSRESAPPTDLAPPLSRLDWVRRRFLQWFGGRFYA